MVDSYPQSIQLLFCLGFTSLYMEFVRHQLGISGSGFPLQSIDLLNIFLINSREK